MWIDVEFEPLQNPTKKEIVRRLLAGIGIVVFNILLSLAFLWTIMLGLNIRLSGFSAFVAWLAVYMLPGIERKLKEVIT